MSTLILCFSIGSVFSLIYIYSYSSKNEMQISIEPHADWPEYDINSLTNRADIIVIGKVKNNKKSLNKINDDLVLDRQFSNIEVKKTLKGNSEKQIVINQTIDYVDKGEKYLFFLSKGEDGYYYPLSDKAIIVEKKGEYHSEIDNLYGVFGEDEIVQKVEVFSEK